MRKTAAGFVALAALAGAASAIQAMGEADSRWRGALSVSPAASWEWSYISGNGSIGVMDMGRPGDETLVVSHARLFVPVNERPSMPDLGEHLEEARQKISREGYVPATEFLMAKAKPQGYERLLFTNPFHPGLELNVSLRAVDGGADAQTYERRQNYLNGELSTRWSEGTGRFERRMFISRADNVMVLEVRSLANDAGERPSFDLQVTIPEVPDSPVRAYNQNRGASSPLAESAANRLIHSQVEAAPEGLLLRNRYHFASGGPFVGYDAALRLAGSDGNTRIDGRSMALEGATSVVLLLRLEPTLREDASTASELMERLGEFNGDYQALLKRHSTIHGGLMDRVQVDFGGGADRSRSSESLLEQALAENTISPALLERLYDGSRYTILSSSGIRPPNLQGIWTGTWEPPWSGDYTTDTNLQLAIAHLLSCNTPELLEGYFSLIEDSLDDWRANARMLYGVNGLHAPTRQSDNGLMFHWNVAWPLSFWTPGAAWLSHWFYEYYLYTGDADFLEKRALPLMVESALFFEEFLFEDASGFYRFSPSYSAENGALDNSTQDISIVRQLLRNLIAGYGALGRSHPKMALWNEMLEKLPPYVVDLATGELQEWALPNTPNENNHRHLMHLYGLFQSFEFDRRVDPELWTAAEKAYLGRMDGWFRNPENVGSRRSNQTSSHGRVHLALCAARLGRGEDLWELLTRMATHGAVYPSMATAHYERGSIFNMDANGAIPEAINNALLFGLPGEIDLLPARPTAMAKGEIRGLALRGGILAESLRWSESSVQLTLRSAVDQSVVLRLGLGEGEMRLVEGSEGHTAEAGREWRLSLKSGESTTFHFER